MASGKILKDRIKSIKNIKKVTKSMELISAIKLQKTAERSKSVNSFRKRLGILYSDITIPKKYSNLLMLPNSSTNHVFIVFASDRGLCGNLNTNILKAFFKTAKDIDKSNVECVIYGKTVAKRIKNAQFKINELYAVPETNFDFGYVALAVQNYIDRYLKGEIGSLTLIFTEFLSFSKQEIKIRKLLPLEQDSNFGVNISEDESDDIFEPTPKRVLDYLILENIKMTWYSALMNSMASEHIARMLSMKNATDASQDLIQNLTLEYNKSRQSAITQEIGEIISGVESLTVVQEDVSKFQKFTIFVNNKS